MVVPQPEHNRVTPQTRGNRGGTEKAKVCPVYIHNSAYVAVNARSALTQMRVHVLVGMREPETHVYMTSRPGALMVASVSCTMRSHVAFPMTVRKACAYTCSVVVSIVRRPA